MNFKSINTKIAAMQEKEKEEVLKSLSKFEPRLKPFLNTYIEENLNERIKTLDILDKNSKILKKIIKKEIELKNNKYYYLIKKYCDVEPEGYLIPSKKEISEDKNLSQLTNLYKRAKMLKPNSLAYLAYFLWSKFEYGRENEESDISLP